MLTLPRKADTARLDAIRDIMAKETPGIRYAKTEALLLAYIDKLEADLKRGDGELHIAGMTLRYTDSCGRWFNAEDVSALFKRINSGTKLTPEESDALLRAIRRS